MTKKLSPHDRFTRSLMTNPKVAEEFFRKSLPEHIKKAIDFSSIELKKESYIDDKLKLQITDLLYSARFNGREGFLYVLLEHASTPDRFLPFRMHKYVSAIMEDHLKNKENKTLPLVYPMILYSGKTPYKHSMSFFDLFLEDERELAKEIFTSPYHLIDLTQVSDEELKQYMWFGTMALALKHIRDPNIVPFFESIIGVLKELEKRGEEAYIYTVITYMAGTGEVPEKSEFFETTKKLESVNEERIMSTLVEQLQPELLNIARKQSFKEGRQEERKEMAKTLFSNGVSIDIIARTTKFSEKEIKSLVH
jgi:predicted transposase/invertase (TIGR01784 family)